MSEGKELRMWADEAMYESVPNAMAEEGLPVHPQVTLISQTPNPLRVMAAACGLYKGDIRKGVEEVTEFEARYWLEEMKKTKLQAGLEFIDFHFMIEGISRPVANQMTRQRTAVFVQESLRFAVKTNAANEVAMPPSIAQLKPDHPLRKIWTNADLYDQWVYNSLINGGIPAEDARGRLPMNITTRLHYKTTLRGLNEHAGMRLCSQAQFEWKAIWVQIIDAILNYGPPEDSWQQEAIADMFKPVCYQTGRCQFRGENDRHCAIRDRVEAHYHKGEEPDEWDDINPLEPVMEGAARRAAST